MTNLNSSIRILHVIPNLRTGGAERVALDLMHATNSSAASTRLCVLGSIDDCHRSDQCLSDVVTLGFSGSLRDVLGIWRCVRSLQSLIQTWEPHIVHSHLWPAAYVAGLATRGMLCRHIVHVHDAWGWLSSSTLRGRMMRTITRWTVRASRPTLVFVGTNVRNYTVKALEFEDLPSVVVPNGVDVTKFYPSPIKIRSEKLRIGIVARLVPEKGLCELLRATSELTKRGINMELHVAGDGSHLGAFRELAADLAIADIVTFYGKVQNVAEFLRTLDVFVLPSHFEGLPLTILESMATGVPVIASRVGSIPELVNHGENGLLIGPRDIDGLVKAITLLAEDEKLRIRLGASGISTVAENFSFESVVQRLQSVYSSPQPLNR
jgi:glycosyltransferase involved in cell wall biosynthesis